MRWIQVDGQLIPADEVTAKSEGHFVQGAIKPFVSMVDGKTYDSRYAYEREVHARGYEIVGNDIDHLLKPRTIPDFAPQERKELIRTQIMNMGHEGFKKALSRDVEFVKWNSRGLPK